MELESVPKAQRRVGELKKAISGLGNINLDAIEEFQRINERYTYLTDQRDDVTQVQEGVGGHHRRHHRGDENHLRPAVFRHQRGVPADLY
ncbi:MAG: hypothetical protein ACLRWQ_09360 [Flavonifractor plautii]